MRKSIFVVALILGTMSCGNPKTQKDMNNISDPLDGPVVEMTTSLGKMSIRLFNATPAHRDNFLKLTREGFYDSTLFHRVISGFMIQGGDPLSKDDANIDRWGTGGPGYTVPAEFNPALTHCKGAVAAARQGDMVNPRRASSGSQFYIVQDSTGCRHLDGQYTVYGQVIEGLDVIDRIAAVRTDPYDRPLENVRIEKVRVVEPDAPADSTAVCDTLAGK